MTDNEIIKALGCCSSREVECRRCPCADTNGSCYDNSAMLKGVLDLINRQKAEIKEKDEMLSAQADKIRLLEMALKERVAEIEEQKDENRNFRKLCDKAIKTYRETRAEAIKEFAERLKEINNNRGWFCGVFNTDIDNLLKEMTEGNR